MNGIAEQAYVNKLNSYKIDSMMRQFNRLFPSEKKRLPCTTKTATASQVFPPKQTRKPYFSNFDFVPCLLCAKSVDVTMFAEVRFSKTNNAEMSQNFCRQKFYFMKHYISFWNQNSKALKCLLRAF